MYRRRPGAVEVLLVHPGGPFWAKKDRGAWSIPKGEYKEGEDPLDAARREFEEETGRAAGEDLRELAEVRQNEYKVVKVWAFEGDFDPSELRSNTFAMEWPAGSGRMQEFPEADRAAWFPLAEARRRILRGQLPLLVALERMVTPGGGG